MDLRSQADSAPRAIWPAALGALAALLAATMAALLASPAAVLLPAPGALAAKSSAGAAAAPKWSLANGTPAARVQSIARQDQPPAIHAALVLDGSLSMAGEPNQMMQDAALGFLLYLDPERYPERRVAVTEFTHVASRHCDLTNVVDEAAECIRAVGAGGGSAPYLGLEDGLAALRDGRLLAPGGARESIVLLTDGGHASGCEPLMRTADEAEAEGVALFTICLGTECDSACLRNVSSGNGYCYDPDDPSELLAIFNDIARRLVGGLPLTATHVPTPTATHGPTPTATHGMTPTGTHGPTPTPSPTERPEPPPDGSVLFMPRCARFG
ncbi:MAG: VWA domain-containing protein [Anaerolineae bacterium]